jgi:hypothetical protein
MGPSDPSSDLGERRITYAGIFESVFRHGECVCAAMPLAHQPGAGLEAEAGIWRDSTFGPEHFCQRFQLATRRLAEPAVLDFLKLVADSPYQ